MALGGCGWAFPGAGETRKVWVWLFCNLKLSVGDISDNGGLKILPFYKTKEKWEKSFSICFPFSATVTHWKLTKGLQPPRKHLLRIVADSWWERWTFWHFNLAQSHPLLFSSAVAVKVRAHIPNTEGRTELTHNESESVISLDLSFILWKTSSRDSPPNSELA